MNDIPRAPLSFITCDSSFPNAGLRQHARRASASYVERSRLPPMRRFCEPNTTTTHQPIDSTATPFAHHSRRSSVEVLPTCTKNQPSVFSSLHTNNITPPSSSRGHSRNNSLDLPNSTLMSLPPNTMVHHTFISSSNLAPFHHSMAVLRKRYIIGNSGGVEQSSCLATDECKSCDESVAGIGSFNMAGLHLVQRATTPTSPWVFYNAVHVINQWGGFFISLFFLKLLIDWNVWFCLLRQVMVWSNWINSWGCSTRRKKNQSLDLWWL